MPHGPWDTQSQLKSCCPPGAVGHVARQEFYNALVQHCVEEIKNLTALDSILKGKPSFGFPKPMVLHSLLFSFVPSDFAGNDAQEGLSLIQAPGMGLDRLCLF